MAERVVNVNIRTSAEYFAEVPLFEDKILALHACGMSQRDIAYRGTVAGSTAVLWEVRHGISAIPQMAGQGDLGKAA